MYNANIEALKCPSYFISLIPPDSPRTHCGNDDSDDGTFKGNYRGKREEKHLLQEDTESDGDTTDSSVDSTTSYEKKPKQFKGIIVLQPVNSTFREALGYHTSWI